MKVSTRDQILEALSEEPAGLTLKQLAEFCTACDYDEQIVGTMIAILDRENVIHCAEERRDGATVWIFGRRLAEVAEPHLSLAGGDRRPSSATSEAARAISGMRQTSTRTRAHATPSLQGPALTVRAKIERVLHEYGPMRSCDIAEHLPEKDIGNHCSSLATRNLLRRLGGTKRGTIYGLPGQTLQDRKPGQEILPAKGRVPATLSRPANGGGGAVTSAAGPAVAEPSLSGLEKANDLAVDLHKLVKREFPEAVTRQHDNLCKAALLDLQDRRAATLSLIEAYKLDIATAERDLGKIDRAIEAMRELA